MINGVPLTAEGGEINIDAELRKSVCMLGSADNAQLYYSKSASPALLMAFESRIRQRGIKYTKKLVEPEEVNKLYKRHTTDGKKTQTQLSVKELFELASKAEASDLHIYITENVGTIIKFRMDGKLIEQKALSRTYEDGMSLINSISMSMSTGANKEIYQENSFFNARINDAEFLPDDVNSLRINISPTDDGSRGVLCVNRLQYRTANFGTLESIGFNQNQIHSLKYLQSLPNGIVIFSGPTGSGKTTSIAVNIDGILKDCDYTKNCLTIEDPPEIIVPGVIPIKVNIGSTQEEREQSLQLALSNMMRQDPDIAMVGEIRDRSTAEIAFEGAMTGHVVLATLHANNSLAAIYRLRELNVPTYLLHDHKILTGIVAQRLVPKLCPHCKQSLIDHSDKIKSSELKRYQKVTNFSQIFIRGDGCDHCNHTGHKGRTVVAEVLITDSKLMQLIASNKVQEAHEYLRGSKGFISLVDAAIEKVEAGLLDPRDAEYEVGPLTMEIIERDGHIDYMEIKEMVGDD
ncbi:MAG: Flp pilus assembly complex ATPase component TadA [Methyloprofundus sp.]|nr:Flp pilus assembly complex ATPase component TadA [Methyloprofundus sp.]